MTIIPGSLLGGIKHFLIQLKIECLQLIIGMSKLHIQTVLCQKGLTRQRRVYVGGMRNRLTDCYKTAGYVAFLIFVASFVFYYVADAMNYLKTIFMTNNWISNPYLTDCCVGECTLHSNLFL